MSALEQRQGASAADARLIAEACLQAASEVGLSKEGLGAIARLPNQPGAQRPAVPEQGGAAWDAVSALVALMGSDPELIPHWLEQPNHHLGEQAPRQLLASVEGLARVAAYLDAMRA